MDFSALLPIVGPIVTSAILYLKDEAAQKIGDKAAETIGEKAGDAIAEKGTKALSLLRNWFHKTGDTKAQKALAAVEEDPDDADYKDKLIKETARVAQTNPAFAQELKVLADQVNIAQEGGTINTFNNTASNYGAQGTFQAPVTFNNTPNKPTN